MQALLGKVSGGIDLSEAEMAAAVDTIMRGHATDAEIAMLLSGLHHKGETVDEIVGAARALRRHMTLLGGGRPGLLDTCGTGGDGLGTFNISTAAALVTAAAGVPVAKHGNRRASSLSGSADVLAALGVNVEASLERVEACLDTLGICFCFAPLFHASMKHVAAVRRQLGFPTIFNLLGPLVNPAGAEFQLIGVGRAEVRPLVAEALARLGTKLALVVHGDDGLDELSIAGPSMVSEARPGSVREFRWAPTDFCLAAQPGADLRVAGPEESAAMIRQVLAGNPGPARDVVVLNAGAALWTAGQHEHKLTCAAAAAEAIDNGAAAGLLARLAEFSHA